MKFQMFSLGALGFALLLVNSTAFAAKDLEKATHDGKVVSITSAKLVMTNLQGKEHSHQIATEATVTLDGKACKADVLKPGTKIRVTTKAGEPKVVTGIEAIEKNEDFKKPE